MNTQQTTSEPLPACAAEPARVLRLTLKFPLPASGMTIEQFCIKHHACEEGREWALASCSSMEEVWEKAKPNWLFWVATRPSVLTDKELRLFAVFCARQVQHLMTDSRSIEAIDVAEKYAQDKASDDELAAARSAARSAAWSAARSATTAAAWAATAAADAAYAAARAAADAVAAAADAAAWAASNPAIKESQAAWLRENTTPNFL